MRAAEPNRDHRRRWVSNADARRMPHERRPTRRSDQPRRLTIPATWFDSRRANAATEKRSAFSTARSRLEVEPVEAFDRSCERVHVVGARQAARPPIQDRLQRAAGGGRDHRPSRCLRLNSRDPELLDARHEQRAGARIELHEIPVADAAEELGLRVGVLERAMVRTRADDLDRRTSATRCLERQMQALVADQLGDDQQRVAGLTRCEAMRLDGRMDDRGVTAVVPPDPLARETRVGDVVVNTAASGAIPCAYASQLSAQQRAQRRARSRRALSFLRARRSETARGSRTRAPRPSGMRTPCANALLLLRTTSDSGSRSCSTASGYSGSRHLNVDWPTPKRCRCEVVIARAVKRPFVPWTSCSSAKIGASRRGRRSPRTCARRRASRAGSRAPS